MYKFLLNNIVILVVLSIVCVFFVGREQKAGKKEVRAARGRGSYGRRDANVAGWLYLYKGQRNIVASEAIRRLPARLI